MTQTNPAINALTILINQIIETDPVEVDGYKWAAVSEWHLCSQFGVNERTMRRWISKPPFDRTRARIDGKVRCLIRLGERDGLSRRETRNRMAAIWCRHTGLPKARKKDFGPICELIDVWPEGMAPDLLRFTLDHWKVFCSAVKYVAAPVAGKEFDRYYKFPVLGLVREYPHITIELMTMEMQAKGSKHAT